jgi:glycosyltransferase involved in cell wall biosynthesis
MSLRIGVNALYLIPGGVGGTEIYLRGLLKALARIDHTNQYFIFTNEETDAGLVPRAENFHLQPQRVRARNRPARILWEQFRLPFVCRNRGIQVLFNPGFTAPALALCPMVTVFHDLQHKRHPENFRWFDLPAWRLLLWLSATRSSHLLADSEATRRDFLHYYRLPESRVTTAPLAADDEFFEMAAARRPERFFLAVSTLHPHKNLDRLLRAFAVFRREDPSFRLVITGLRGFAAQELESLRSQLGLADSAEFTGWIPRADRYALYARAWACIYPSRFEGFGLPAVEAMAAGVPLACSDIPVLAETTAGAALHFDPESDRALVDVMRRLASDQALCARLSQAGPLQAARYRWDQTARITWNALQSASCLWQKPPAS